MIVISVFVVIFCVNIVHSGCCGSGTPCEAQGTQDGGRCSLGWEYKDDKCYKLIFPVTTTSTVVDTKALCTPEGAHGASITSQEQNDWIADYALRAFQAAGKSPERQNIILGAHLEADGKTFDWDGTGGDASCPFTYTNWAPREPTGGGWGSVLFELDNVNSAWGAGYKGKWNDAWDTYPSGFPALCVKDAFGAPPNASSCDYKPQPQGSCSCRCNCRQRSCSPCSS